MCIRDSRTRLCLHWRKYCITVSFINWYRVEFSRHVYPLTNLNWCFHIKRDIHMNINSHVYTCICFENISVPFDETLGHVPEVKHISQKRIAALMSRVRMLGHAFSTEYKTHYTCKNNYFSRYIGKHYVLMYYNIILLQRSNNCLLYTSRCV